MNELSDKGPPKPGFTEATGDPLAESSQNLPAAQPRVPAKAKAGLTDTAEVPVVRNERNVVGTDSYGEGWSDDAEDEDRTRHFDAKRRRRARRVTALLALIAAIGVGFAGGVLYQKHVGGSSTASTSGAPNLSALRAAFGGGSGSGASAGGAASVPSGLSAGGFAGFGGGNSVVGTVSAVSGNTLYVSQGSSSALTKVETSSTSTVTVPSTASVSDIQPGDTVVIRGAKQSNGSYMAATITDSGASSSTGTGTTGGSSSSASSPAG